MVSPSLCVLFRSVSKNTGQYSHVQVSAGSTGRALCYKCYKRDEGTSALDKFATQGQTRRGGRRRTEALAGQPVPALTLAEQAAQAYPDFDSDQL